VLVDPKWHGALFGFAIIIKKEKLLNNDFKRAWRQK
jgi:hypothetical protein